jgi:heptosyltransferase III
MVRCGRPRRASTKGLLRKAISCPAPFGHGSVKADSEPRASSTPGDDWKSCTGEHRLEEHRTGGPKEAVLVASRRLIIRPGGIGDCILSLPSIQALRTETTEVWVPSSVVPLIRGAEARAIASTGIDLLALPGVESPPGLIAKLRSFDSIVSWYGANRPEFREQVQRIGLPFQFLDALPEPGAKIHAADFFLGQALRKVAGDGVAVPRIECNRYGRDNFAVIHPFSGSARKNWPLNRFRELAERLALPVRWCAGPEEAMEDAVRFENLYHLACWIASARVYIGNDSGITHLAAAVGTPVVAIFGPTDPAVWAPRGARVSVVSGGSLDAISVDVVLEAVENAECRF